MLFHLQNEKKLRIKNISKYDLTFFLILVTFLCFATSYSLITPMFEAPDEPFHYTFPKDIAEGNLVHTAYLRHQPLYYVILAGPLYFIDYPDEVNTIRNPFTKFDKSYYLHGDEEIFPFSGTAQAVHILRFFSILFGTITVIFTYKIAKLIFKNDDWMPLFSMAFIALIPKFLFINSVLNNDVLIWTFSTITIFYILKFSTNPDKIKFLILTSIFCGLAIISKMSGVILVPLVFSILAYHFITKQSEKKYFLKNIFIFGIISLISGGWYVYFKIIRAFDPDNFHLGSIVSYFWGAHRTNVPDLDLSTNIAFNFDQYNSRIFDGVWGKLGWINITAHEIFFYIALFFVIVSIVGLFLFLFKKNLLSNLKIEKNHLIVLLFSAGFIQLLIFGIMVLGSGYARNGFIALSPTIVLFSIGIYALFKPKIFLYIFMLSFTIFLIVLNIQLLLIMDSTFDNTIGDNTSIPLVELLDGNGTNPLGPGFTDITFGELENGHNEAFLFLHPSGISNTWWNFTYNIPETRNFQILIEYGFVSVNRTKPVQFGAYVDNQELFLDKKNFTGELSLFEKSFKKYPNDQILISLYTNSLNDDRRAGAIFIPQIIENNYTKTD